MVRVSAVRTPARRRSLIEEEVRRAGHETANIACARALSGAGFVPAEGPPRHTLQDGREIESRWLHHLAPYPTSHCRGSGLPVPRTLAGRATGEGL
ncbi:hypothetical protein Saso_76410 [Streptomyces asoensis]|uniref:Uncharacterized protein n=1 Tax=Streptomyces asoensis TaxID=249586 RepID=A0ABQ3SCY0_9ACTN|nr:hypothetical protein GCM10010496_65640 [Streptomyces asoensis]GHI65991.1 hypothetical protein Saso_76410 [Streptomyces asoensis]